MRAGKYNSWRTQIRGMRSITVNVLLVSMAQGNATEQPEHSGSTLDSIDSKSSNSLVDKLVDDLSERMLKASSLHHANFDGTMGRKPGQVAIPPQCQELLAVMPWAAPARQLQQTTENTVQTAESTEKPAQEDTKTTATETAATEDAGMATNAETEEEKPKPDDLKSIWIGNVEYATTAEELHNIFSKCGTVNHITIKTDRDGNSKAFAYIEFMEQEAVAEAVKLDGTEHRGRVLKVSPKRTNLAGHPMKRKASGAGYDPYGMMGYMPPMMPMGRGRGRGCAPYMMPMYNPYMMPMMPMRGGGGPKRGRFGAT